jgi:hypothetical protein
MKTIRLRSYVDKDGSVKIQLPEHHNEEVELLVVYQSVEAGQKPQWSQKFLTLFGAWQGDPLERAPQETQPERMEML